ncbi:MAG: hypothetical protein WC915_05205 [archaeon]|jgi:hypothetical protein
MPLFNLLKARPKGTGKLFWSAETQRIEAESFKAKQKHDQEINKIENQLKRQNQKRQLEKRIGKIELQRREILKATFEEIKQNEKQVNIKNVTDYLAKLREHAFDLAGTESSYRRANDDYAKEIHEQLLQVQKQTSILEDWIKRKNKTNKPSTK